MKFSLAGFTLKSVLDLWRQILLECKLAVKSLGGKGWINVRFSTMGGIHLDFRVKHYGEFDLTNDNFFDDLVRQIDDHVYTRIQDHVDISSIDIYLLEVE